MSVLLQFLNRVKSEGKKRPGSVKTTAMGRERTFTAYDVGSDTFIFEDGIAAHLAARPSVLIVEKRALRGRGKGRVMTLSTGNHAVAAIPLMDGRFWKLSHIPLAKRGEVLMHDILCCNIVNGRIETSQRDVPSKVLCAADEWSVELSLANIVEAPVEKGARLGSARLVVNGEAVAETDLLAAEGVKKLNLASALQRVLADWPLPRPKA